jgi:hypothetical protein
MHDNTKRRLLPVNAQPAYVAAIVTRPQPPPGQKRLERIEHVEKNVPCFNIAAASAPPRASLVRLRWTSECHGPARHRHQRMITPPTSPGSSAAETARDSRTPARRRSCTDHENASATAYKDAATESVAATRTAAIRPCWMRTAQTPARRTAHVSGRTRPRVPPLSAGSPSIDTQRSASAAASVPSPSRPTNCVNGSVKATRAATTAEHATERERRRATQ